MFEFDRCRPFLDNCVIRNNRVLGNNYNTIANIIALTVAILLLACGTDDTIISNTRVLINDGILNACVAPDSERRQPSCLIAID